MQVVTFCTKYDTFNAIYVNAGDTNEIWLKSPNSQLATLYNVTYSMHMLMQLIQRKDFIRIDLFLMLMQSMHSVHNIDTFNGIYSDAVNAIKLQCGF